MTDLVHDSYWVYVQSTGELFRPNGSLCGVGYSGHKDGKNNPILQNVRNTGPLPCGFYQFGHAMDHPLLGPVAIPLTPDPRNEMYGRSHFYLHGDNAEHSASLGCIVQGRPAREEVVKSLNGRLKVIDRPAPRQILT